MALKCEWCKGNNGRYHKTVCGRCYRCIEAISANAFEGSLLVENLLESIRLCQAGEMSFEQVAEMALDVKVKIAEFNNGGGAA